MTASESSSIKMKKILTYGLAAFGGAYMIYRVVCKKNQSKCSKIDVDVYASKRGGFADCVGSTPLVKLNSLSSLDHGCIILGKAEFLNPGGSTKDRIAREIVLDAEKRGDLRPGGT